MKALFIISKTGSNEVTIQYVNDTVVHSNSKPLLTNKTHWSNKKDMDESQMYTGKGEKAGWKAYMRYDSNHMTFQKRQNYRDDKKKKKKTTSDCWEFGQEGGEQNR